MKVVLASPIAPDAIERLAVDHEVEIGFDGTRPLESLVDACELLIFRSGVQISRDLLERAKKLELVVRAGSGFDNIDLDYCEDNGIRVVRIPGPSSQAVAEFTLGLILSLSRRIREADAEVRSGRWPKPELVGSLVAGKTLGIVGAGRIGRRVAEMCALIGMDVLACVDRPVELHPLVLTAKHIKLTDFDTVVENSDVLSIHVPLNETTTQMIDASVMSRMPPGALLINTARGGIVDEAGLLDALESGKLGGAALDVHEIEGEGVPSLARLPNVILTPHIGAMALESQSLIGRRLIELVEAHLRGDLGHEATSEEVLV